MFDPAKITDVRIKLDSGQSGKLRAYVSVVLENSFVIKDMKLIETRPGCFMISMPSKLRSFRCSTCGHKNPVRSNYCMDCGSALGPPPLHDEGDYVELIVVKDDAIRYAIRDLAVQAYREAMSGVG